jgi:hypothetical protein
LFLKVQEDEQAFPYIEKLARTFPDEAEDLIDEFLQVWTKNHNPNAERSRTSYYMFMYGFEQRAEGIPLTRSKQQRNLEELADLVRRLNALPIGDVDQQLLAKAFTTCHSSAEVYRLEAIEKVFGPIKDLKPETLAELAQQMRANLVGIWKTPAEQKKKKTNRKKKDIQAEVFRGYEVARTVVTDALAKHPKSWQLMLARAAIDHDENNYRQDLANDSGFTSRRKQALATFAKAAELYAQKVPSLEADEQTTKVYDLWFYASLGAVDLGQVNEERIAALKEPAKIREAIMSLPGDHAQHHLDMFANNLFTRMSSAGPAVKFRYLKGGFEIVGDNKRAHEARKVYDYYNDLVTEIKLEALVDGSDVVGSEKPFGLFVNIRHTREIERESGGFGRYLQNQNNAYWYYNYGRPTQNYRDKFEEIVHQAFDEQFEVQSVTFQGDDVNSRALDEYGWRYTPYAYIQLKARSPKVDKIPPLRLDLDFLDTSGYVVLPIESPPVPVDASGSSAEPRPYGKLAVTQTLDERQSNEGKLILEVKATSQGLVPELDQFLDLTPKGFKQAEIEDDGSSVSQFDPESPDNVIDSERIWLITFEAADGLEKLPESFAFGKAKVDVDEMLYQRFDDADLAKVEPTVTLGETYGEVDRTGTWVTLGAAGLGLIALVVGFLVFRKQGGTETAEDRFAVPEEITPFTVIGFLREIESNNGLTPDGLRELSASMQHIERYYFDRSEGDAPDLQRIAVEWSGRAGGRID